MAAIHSLSPGQHLVVYMPVDLPDVDLKISPEAWIVDSYEEACETIEEFIKGADFIPDVDARFEIFDDTMEPVADQRLIEELMLESMMEEEGREDRNEFYNLPTEADDPMLRETSAHPIVIQKVDENPPSKPVKEVQFDEIEIEDKRR